VNLDRLARQLGFRRLASGDLEALRASEDPDAPLALQMLKAYTDGINWVLSESLRAMPAEFWLTGQRRIEPWDALDTLSLMRLYGFVMCFGFQHALLRSALIELFGKERALAWTATAEAEPTIPHTLDEAALRAFREANLSGAFNPGVSALPRDQGSNWWVIHGSHTTTGKPLLVGDPHLTIKIPMFWYEAHLLVRAAAPGQPGINAYGVAPPGVPGLLIGQNGFFATSITLAFCDVEDVFLERFRRSDGRYLHKGEWKECEVHEEQILVKGGAPEPCVCQATCHGAVLEGGTLMQFDPFHRNVINTNGTDESADEETCDVKLAYAGAPLRPGSSALLGIRKILSARCFADFDRALAEVSRVISLNFAYADVEGHIGYICTGEVPIRGGGRGSELLPLVGWTGEQDWQGFVPHAELPKAFDPPSGIIISANHKIVDYSTYPHYLGQVWKSGYRAQAIKEELARLMEGGAKVSPAQMPAVLMNVRSPAAMALVDVLRSVQPDADTAAALAMLTGWDCELGTESVAASLYQFVHAELVQLLLRGGCRALGAPPARPPWEDLQQETLCEIVAGDSFDPLAMTKLINEFQGHLHLNVLRILQSAEAPEAEGAGRRWWLEQVGGRDAAVNAAVRAAEAKLRDLAGSDDWRTSRRTTWGAVHVCHMGHPVSRSLGLPPGTPPFDAPSVPSPGDTNTILQAATKSLTDFTATASNVSLRVMYDLSDLSAASTNRIIAPLGQSGQFNSGHYHDQTELWRRGELRPMRTSEEAVRAAATATLRFERARPRGTWTAWCRL